MALPTNRTGAGVSSYGPVTQDHQYETDLGYAVMPVAGRTPAFRRIRLHGGIAFRRVKWSAQRKGKPPIIPSPADLADGVGTTDYLLAHTVVPSLPVPNIDAGGYNWAVAGEYVYVQAAPRVVGVNTLPTGGFPFAVGGPDDLAGAIATQAGALNANTTDDQYAAIESGVDHIRDSFFWPFTALSPTFSASDLIGS